VFSEGSGSDAILNALPGLVVDNFVPEAPIGGFALQPVPVGNSKGTTGIIRSESNPASASSRATDSGSAGGDGDYNPSASDASMPVLKGPRRPGLGLGLGLGHVSHGAQSGVGSSDAVEAIPVGLDASQGKVSGDMPLHESSADAKQDDQDEGDLIGDGLHIDLGWSSDEEEGEGGGGGGNASNEAKSSRSEGNGSNAEN